MIPPHSIAIQIVKNYNRITRKSPIWFYRRINDLNITIVHNCLSSNKSSPGWARTSYSFTIVTAPYYPGWRWTGPETSRLWQLHTIDIPQSRVGVTSIGKVDEPSDHLHPRKCLRYVSVVCTVYTLLGYKRVVLLYTYPSVQQQVRQIEQQNKWSCYIWPEPEETRNPHRVSDTGEEIGALRSWKESKQAKEHLFISTSTDRNLRVELLTAAVYTQQLIITNGYKYIYTCACIITRVLFWWTKAEKINK